MNETVKCPKCNGVGIIAGFRLYTFSKSSGSGEFVVISDLPQQEILDEYTTERVALDRVVDIDGDATSFPCDRPLRAFNT